MRVVAEILATCLALLAVFFGISIIFSSSAHALSDPLASVTVYQFTCGTTATNIKNPAFPKSAKSLRIVNMGVPKVWLGGPNVTGADTNGYAICNDVTCDAKALPIDANPVVWCATASGTVLVTVVSGY